MNDIEAGRHKRESRTERKRRERRLRRLVQVTGLTALSVTLLAGAQLIQPTYSMYTAEAEMSGGFATKASFCGPEDDRHDRTVAEALYAEPGNGHCMDDPGGMERRRDVGAPESPAKTEPPAGPIFQEEDSE